jgi:hypothetical protein
MNPNDLLERERDEFSVYQFFPDGSYEAIKRFVSAKEAVQTAKFYINNVSAKRGFTKRVIITDGGDCINFEWTYGKGITFPNLKN